MEKETDKPHERYKGLLSPKIPAFPALCMTVSPGAQVSTSQKIKGEMGTAQAYYSPKSLHYVHMIQMK